MLLTLASLVRVATQELGRTPAKSTAEELVNEAGEAWVNAHPWRYLRDRSQDINIVDGQNLYRLPLGVRSVGEFLLRPDSVYQPIPIVNYEAFISEKERWLSEVERQLTPIATTTFKRLPAAENGDPSGKDDDRLRFYIELYPANFTERVVVTFNAGWLPLDNASDEADIPPHLSRGFTEWMRRFAMAREKPDTGPMDVAQLQFFEGPVGMEAKRVDGEGAGTIVPTLGGVGKRYWQKRCSASQRQDQLEHLRYHTPQ